jgi:hypothetical protein
MLLIRITTIGAWGQPLHQYQADINCRHGAHAKTIGNTGLNELVNCFPSLAPPQAFTTLSYLYWQCICWCTFADTEANRGTLPWVTFFSAVRTVQGLRYRDRVARKDLPRWPMFEVGVFPDNHLHPHTDFHLCHDGQRGSLALLTWGLRAFLPSLPTCFAALGCTKLCTLSPTPPDSYSLELLHYFLRTWLAYVRDSN